MMTKKFALAFAALAPALVLSACAKPKEVDYEVAAEDKGGGELIVREVDPNEVPVDLPDTPMVPADEDSGEQSGETSE